MKIIYVSSFGYGFLEPNEALPFAHKTEDVRHSLRNPPSKDLLRLNGCFPELQEFVLKTDGAPELIQKLVAFVTSSQEDALHIAIGCRAGRHRSVALVEILAQRLREIGYEVVVTHVHLEWAMAEKPLLH